MNKTMRRLLIIAPALLLIPGILIAGCSSNSQTQQTAIIGQLAPDFTLADLDGNSVSLTDFAGKPMLINFWNTGCPPCRNEMPYLQELYDENRNTGLVLLTIDIGESVGTVKDFLEDNNLALPVLLDSKGAVAQLYIKRGIPTTVLIDKDGIIQEIRVGAFRNKESIENTLSKIMP